jgi:hypothetical protein
MNISKNEILDLFTEWLKAWDNYNLEGVLELLHEDIVFENWTGATIIGKNALRKTWTPWFCNHANFKFIKEDVFIDEQEQKMLFRWKMEWPSIEKGLEGKHEVRKGVDVLHFKDAKIHKKYTYSKTTILVDKKPITLCAKV